MISPGRTSQYLFWREKQRPRAVPSYPGTLSIRAFRHTRCLFLRLSLLAGSMAVSRTAPSYMMGLPLPYETHAEALL
jgi:hypothetical protein